MTGIEFPAGAGDFSLFPCVQAGSGAHTVSYPMGTAGPWRWSGWGMKLTAHLHLAPRLRMDGAIPPLPHTSL